MKRQTFNTVVAVLIVAAMPAWAKASATLTEVMESALGSVPGVVSAVKLEKGLYEMNVRNNDGSVQRLCLDPVTGEVIEREDIRGAGEAEKRDDMAVRFKGDYYRVSVKRPDGIVVEVHVDAGDGEVIRTR